MTPDSDQVPHIADTMGDDALDDLLNLEENYYQEGYDLGEADGTHAGLVEGKLFGVEKGFEKAMSMGRLSGRADVWLRRSRPSRAPTLQAAEVSTRPNPDTSIQQAQAGPSTDLITALSAQNLPPLFANTRLGRHIESLLATTESTSFLSTNSDEAVAQFDERLTKAMAKAKVITNIIAEPSQIEDAVKQDHRSIEESGSLSARR